MPHPAVAALPLRAGPRSFPRHGAEARRRYAAPNLRFAVTGGRGLATCDADSFDLLLAVDTFPYLMQAGMAIAERHVADAARLLRAGGHLAILNLSYGRSLDADRADVTRWADAFGFGLIQNGEARSGSGMRPRSCFV